MLHFYDIVFHIILSLTQVSIKTQRCAIINATALQHVFIMPRNVTYKVSETMEGY